jgi:hypothetical protein
MPLETYPDQSEPGNHDAVIWRFMNMAKFHDLMTTGELYFCRADCFPNDEKEGLPPEEYLPILGLNPFDLHDRQNLNDSLGCAAQFREAFYISCWHLFHEETAKMWNDYGEDGVAICSKYWLLRAALDAMKDRAFLGLVRYGSKHLTGWNILRHITTKRFEFADEKEVRAFLWIVDPYAGINRHLDADNRAHPRPLTPPPDRVLTGERRKVDLQTLLTEIVVTPWAAPETFKEVDDLVKNGRYTIPVLHSALAHYREFLPRGPIAPKRQRS